MLGHKNAELFGAPPLRTSGPEIPALELPVLPPRRPRTILVADGNYLAASELAFAVECMGYKVLGPVTDGVDALNLARRNLPDLAILSIPMPGLDGLALTRELSHTFDIPCVIASACPEPECINAAHAQGASYYLIKPVQDEDLRAAIDLSWHRHCQIALARLQARAICEASLVAA